MESVYLICLNYQNLASVFPLKKQIWAASKFNKKIKTFVRYLIQWFLRCDLKYCNFHWAIVIQSGLGLWYTEQKGPDSHELPESLERLERPSLDCKQWSFVFTSLLWNSRLNNDNKEIHKDMIPAPNTKPRLSLILNWSSFVMANICDYIWHISNHPIRFAVEEVFSVLFLHTKIYFDIQTFFLDFLFYQHACEMN